MSDETWMPTNELPRNGKMSMGLPRFHRMIASGCRNKENAKSRDYEATNNQKDIFKWTNLVLDTV